MPQNVQSIPNVPLSFPPDQRRFLEILRAAVVRQSAKKIVPPTPVTNLSATAKGGGVIIRFTRSDGDGYILYRNEKNSINDSTRIDLGLANEYTDEIGLSGKTLFYWVKSKSGLQESNPAGPVQATTLPLNAEAKTAPDTPGSEVITRSDETGIHEYGRPKR